LSYFAPVAMSPGFARALSRTLEELALAAVTAGALDGAGEGAQDLAELLTRVDAQFEAVSSVDRAAFLRTATRAAREARGPFSSCRIVLLDVPVTNAAERDLVHALVVRAPGALATVPAGDALSERALAVFGAIESAEAPAEGLDRVRHHLFSPGATPIGEPLDQVELFSAPGEGREAVEIARRILRSAGSGVPFDRMAIALRTPQQYAGLLEHAFERAGIPAFFERGTRRPHPAGRAFLALIACARENLSARRFAEYLSLGQVPARSGMPASDVAFRTSQDEVFGALAARADQQSQEADERAEVDGAPLALRAPWKWERLLAESRVVSSGDRWERRLTG
jgi:ATP-dependent helicase/nuclease subunit B